MPSPEKFRESLEVFSVDRPVADAVCDGFMELESSSPKARKAAFFKRAIDIMDERLEPSLVRDIFEWNACCKSGSRLKASKAFAREHAALPLADKLELIAAAPQMFMGRPVLEPDGTITLNAVTYVCDGKFACACSNFNKLKRDYPVSKHYCYCCGGHFKHHYQIMLGVGLEVAEIVSSPLDSDGASPCVFRLRITG